MTDVMPDFVMDEGKPEQSDVLVELTQLAQHQLEQEEYVEQLEKRLKEAKNLLNKLSQEEIPNLLKSRGLSEVTLSNGMKVTITEDLNVTITDDDKFFNFLKERGEDDIIKANITLGKQKAGMVERLLQFLQTNEYDYASKTDVHAQTKKKYFRDMCGIGLDEHERVKGYQDGTLTPPSNLPEWCKVFTINKTKIRSKRK